MRSKQAEAASQGFGVLPPPEEAPGPSPSPLLEALEGETLTLDELAQRLDQPIGTMLAELLELELAGRVVRAPGGLYRLPA